MTKRALIAHNENDRIVQIAEVGGQEPESSPLEWVDVPDDTTTQHLWDGSKVVAPVVPQEIDESPGEERSAAYSEVLEALVDDPKFRGGAKVAKYRANKNRGTRRLQ